MKLPRFTFRDLFWLVLVFAFALGWWADRASVEAEIDRVRLENAKYLLSLPPTGANHDPALVLPALKGLGR